MSPGRRDTQSPERIRELARTLFFERGYDGTSMQDLASAAHLHKASLYHHVSGKQELLAAVCEAALAPLEASLAAAERHDGPPGERVRMAFAGAARAATGDPRGTGVIIRLQPTNAVARDVVRRRRAYEDRFTGLVAAAQRTGEIRGDVDAQLLARLALGTINATVAWFDPEGRLPSGVVERAVVAVAAEGWTGPRGRRRGGSPTA